MSLIKQLMKKTILWGITGLFALILLSIGVSAQEINLSNSSSGSNWPAIAVNSRGDVMVVWTEWEVGYIYYRLYKDGGWTETRRAGIVQQISWSNRMDVDSSGNFHLSWADGHGSSERDIFYSMFTGSSWQQSERVYRSLHNSAWNWLAVDGSKVHTMWYHKYGATSDSSDVIMNSKSIGGRWPESYENVSQSSSTETIHPAFRASGGDIFAVYMDGGTGVRRLTFRERRAGYWQSPTVLDISGYYPAMDIDSSRNLHIAYSNWSGNFFVRSRMGGSWDRTQIVSNGHAPLQFGDIRQRNGMVAAAFTQKSSDRYAVYYTVRFGTNPWSKPVPVSSGDVISRTSEGYPDDGNRHVQVCVDSNGYAHLVWEGRGVNGLSDIIYKKVKLSEPDFPFIEVDRFALDFLTEEGNIPSPQSFSLRNSGKGTFDYSISTNRDWLTIGRTQGTGGDSWESIQVDVRPGDRGAGTYSGTITITSGEALNSPLTIAVNLVIEQRKTPSIQLNKTDISFFAYARGDIPASQSFQLRNSGRERLDYTVSSNKTWLTVSPTRGVSTTEWDTIDVSVDTSSLDVGNYIGQIQIQDPAADNSPQSVSVIVQVDKPPVPYAPTAVTLSKYSHEGLYLKIFKNRLRWAGNPKNLGLFNIVKYRIWRAVKGGDLSHLADVGSDVAEYYDRDFSTAEERDRYIYFVACLDSDNVESERILSTEAGGSGSASSVSLTKGPVLKVKPKK